MKILCGFSFWLIPTIYTSILRPRDQKSYSKRFLDCVHSANALGKLYASYTLEVFYSSFRVSAPPLTFFRVSISAARILSSIGVHIFSPNMFSICWLAFPSTLSSEAFTPLNVLHTLSPKVSWNEIPVTFSLDSDGKIARYLRSFERSSVSKFGLDADKMRTSIMHERILGYLFIFFLLVRTHTSKWLRCPSVCSHCRASKSGQHTY